MKILNNIFFKNNTTFNIKNNDNSSNINPAFRSANDLTLKYMIKNHEKRLPQRVLEEINNLILSGKDRDFNLIDVHNKVYKKLLNAKNLDEAKKYYNEFENVINASVLENNRSKAIKALKDKNISLDDISLKLLQDIYTPITQEEIVKKYGFTNRSLLNWLMEKLNIKKFDNVYFKLLKMSDPVENDRIAELSRKAIYADAEAQKYRLQRAAEAHKTPEYRTKKSLENKKSFETKPERREFYRELMTIAWDKCPDLKKQRLELLKTKPYKIQLMIMSDNNSEIYKRVRRSFYKEFWNLYPENREIFRQARREAFEEYKIIHGLD